MFLISKNLIIIFKLNTIESFYYTKNINIGFFLFLSHSPREIVKEEKYIKKIQMHCKCERVNT
jgi:hypothetical protein